MKKAPLEIVNDQKGINAAKRSRVSFSILRWSVWLPNKDSPNRRPEISELPMLLRRRASVADSMAFRVAFDCIGSQKSVPTVFCSRHGEAQRSAELLEMLSKNEPLSPMIFGFSIHNAAAALYSIARQDTSSASAVAAGKDTLAAGIFEACSIMASGVPQVLLVAYDDRIPEAFAHFADDTDQPAALALLLEVSDKPSYSLELAPGDVINPPLLQDPQIVQVIRFLQNGDRELSIVSGTRRWLWRHDS